MLICCFQDHKTWLECPYNGLHGLVVELLFSKMAGGLHGPILWTRSLLYAELLDLNNTNCSTVWPKQAGRIANSAFIIKAPEDGSPPSPQQQRQVHGNYQWLKRWHKVLTPFSGKRLKKEGPANLVDGSEDSTVLSTARILPRSLLKLIN
jgi:hypothetical protein